MQSSKQKTNEAQPEKMGLKERIIKNRKLLIIIALMVIAVLAIIYALTKFAHDHSGVLRINGRIEGYETNLGAKIAGRVESISVREGEEVKIGQLVVRLSDEDIQAQLRGAKAKYFQALQQVQEAEELLHVSHEQVRQAKLSVTQAQEDAKGRIEQAAANVATQEATYKQALSEEVQAKADLELARIRIKRYDDLVVKGAVTQDEDDQAHSTYESAVATVDARHAAVLAALKQINAAKAALIQAQSNALNPPIRFSQQRANIRTVAQNEAAVEAAKEEVKNAKASIDQIEANIAYLNIRSPIHGVVTARTVEPGATVAAGQTVLSLIDLDTVFLRAYVPDGEISKIRLGQRANVYYDAAPNVAVKGRVIQIDPQASFTPENIYFREDRVKQVFGIKIQIDNPENYAKPGMPADADVDISSRSGEQLAEDEAPKQNESKRFESKAIETQQIESQQITQQNKKDEQYSKMPKYADPSARANLEPDDPRLVRQKDVLRSPFSPETDSMTAPNNNINRP